MPQLEQENRKSAEVVLKEVDIVSLLSLTCIIAEAE